ncbi:unnamed protein product [Echinostoma caproni]|uniref:C-type lectin domain-containing protein n=1 Tax=Echinostoma caproni TaxID=27848 RepID=A0A183AK79_9TREM|nr:unnamed protein product [Echinostoma caproni]
MPYTASRAHGSVSSLTVLVQVFDRPMRRQWDPKYGVLGREVLDSYNLYQTAPAKCPTGWAQLGNKCFSPIQSTPVTWAQAESACLRQNASLVSIHSPVEHQFIGTHLQFGSAWLGLRVNQNPNHEYSYWSDHSPVDYISFAAKQPPVTRNDGAIERCATLTHDMHDWHLSRCDDRYPYACQLILAPSSNTAHDGPAVLYIPRVLCTDLMGSKYCVEFHAIPATFVHAEETCQSRNMSLATIPSEEHQKFLMDQLKQVPGFTKAFIGLFSPEDTLMWISGYPSVPVAFWTHTAPSGTEQCVYVRSDNQSLFTWESTPCTESLPFVCSSPVSVHEKPTVPFIQQSCPEPYIHIGSGCFLIKADPSSAVSWAEAAVACSKLEPKGHLATVQSLHEQVRLRQQRLFETLGRTVAFLEVHEKDDQSQPETPTPDHTEAFGGDYGCAGDHLPRLHHNFQNRRVRLSSRARSTI